MRSADEMYEWFKWSSQWSYQELKQSKKEPGKYISDWSRSVHIFIIISTYISSLSSSILPTRAQFFQLAWLAQLERTLRLVIAKEVCFHFRVKREYLSGSFPTGLKWISWLHNCEYHVYLPYIQYCSGDEAGLEVHGKRHRAWNM